MSEDRGPDADHVRAFLDGNLIVVAHAEREDIELFGRDALLVQRSIEQSLMTSLDLTKLPAPLVGIIDKRGHTHHAAHS